MDIDLMTSFIDLAAARGAPPDNIRAARARLGDHTATGATDAREPFDGTLCFGPVGPARPTIAEQIAAANKRIASDNARRYDMHPDLDDLRIDRTPRRFVRRGAGRLPPNLDEIAALCGEDPARVRATAGSREWAAVLDAQERREASRIVASSAVEFCRRNRDVLLQSGMSPEDIDAGLRNGSIERLLRQMGAIA